MTIISTHRFHSYMYTPNPKTFRGSMKHMSKTQGYLRNKTQKPQENIVPHDVYTGGGVYTDLKLWFPEILHTINNNIIPITIAATTIVFTTFATASTILQPVIEVDYDDTNEEAWNQLDYQEWLCD